VACYLSRMADALELHVTMPNQQEATALARALVEESLAACVNLIPGIRSIYQWEGRMVEEEEVLCLVKTRPAIFARVRDRILELHTYDVPEILAFRVDDGSPEYLAWLARATPED
jgi:periplasmic divalent cation tolerance protein